MADPTNVAAPTAVIALPTDGQAVTEPVDVIGTVADDVAIRDWQLTYTPLDGGQGGLIAEGTGAIDNGVLGRFDPTILRNGMYLHARQKHRRTSEYRSAWSGKDLRDEVRNRRPVTFGSRTR